MTNNKNKKNSKKFGNPAKQAEFYRWAKLVLGLELELTLEEFSAIIDLRAVLIERIGEACLLGALDVAKNVLGYLGIKGASPFTFECLELAAVELLLIVEEVDNSCDPLSVLSVSSDDDGSGQIVFFRGTEMVFANWSGEDLGALQCLIKLGKDNPSENLKLILAILNHLVEALNDTYGLAA